jgi:hypothetical protein
MKYMNGGSVTLSVKDSVTDQTVVSSTKRMGSGEGWMEFDFIGDSLGYVVEPNHSYSLWVGTDYYSGLGAPCWIYSATDVYSYGSMRQGSVVENGDRYKVILFFNDDLSSVK